MPADVVPSVRSVGGEKSSRIRRVVNDIGVISSRRHDLDVAGDVQNHNAAWTCSGSPHIKNEVNSKFQMPVDRKDFDRPFSGNRGTRKSSPCHHEIMTIMMAEMARETFFRRYLSRFRFESRANVRVKKT
jgi:hypothetical protein